MSQANARGAGRGRGGRRPVQHKGPASYRWKPGLTVGALVGVTGLEPAISSSRTTSRHPLELRVRSIHDRCAGLVHHSASPRRVTPTGSPSWMIWPGSAERSGRSRCPPWTSWPDSRPFRSCRRRAVLRGLPTGSANAPAVGRDLRGRTVCGREVWWRRPDGPWTRASTELHHVTAWCWSLSGRRHELLRAGRRRWKGWCGQSGTPPA